MNIINQIELSAKVLKALGHPIRYKIVKFLLDEPKCVCKLTEDVEFSQSNLSQHLKILKEAGVLESERVGLNVHYRISNEKVKAIIELTDEFAIGFILTHSTLLTRATEFAQKARGAAMSLVAFCFMGGGGVGTAIGGRLIAIYGLSHLFMIYGVALVITLCLSYVFIRGNVVGITETQAKV